MNGQSTSVNSWFDLRSSAPQNPLDLIAEAQLGPTQGVFEFADDFMPPPGGTWSASPISIDAAPTCTALETDNLQMVALAEQWNFDHETANLDSDLAPPLQKKLYLRGGTQWAMHIQLNIGVDIDELLLSFLDNGGTRGDYAGSVPAIRFPGPIVTGVQPLVITLKYTGRAVMGMRTIATASGDWAMYESEWNMMP